MPKNKGTAVRQPAEGAYGQGFRKFQRKMRAGTVIRAILLGLSMGLFTVAVWLLIDKLTVGTPNYLRYAAVAAAVAVVTGALTGIILFPTRRRLARRLDNTLSLGEKVQTMVAFAAKDSPMLAMQREDTDRILRETPKKRVKGIGTWLFITLPLVAILGAVGTVLVPAKEPPEAPPAVEKTWYLKPWEEQALKDLIREVEISDMESQPKTDTVVELETLLKRLKSINRESAMKAEVTSTIVDVHTIVNEYNTYDLLAAQMTQALSAAIRELGESMNTLDHLLISEAMQKIREALEDRSVATDMAAAIDLAVQASGILATNETVAAVSALSDELAALPADADDNTVAALIEKHDEAINAALALQAKNEEMAEYVMYELMSIFGIAQSDLPPEFLAALKPEDDAADDPLDRDDEPEKGNSGGKGDGEQLFGGNDEIYDPETGRYVSYGEVINHYFAKITEMLADGSSPEEIEKALSAYYTALYDGSKKEN